MTAQPAYAKADLQKIVTACFVMATVDGHIDEREIAPIITFTKSNWHSEYGDYNQFMSDTKNRAFELLPTGALMDSLDSKAQTLASSLEDSQRADVLELLSDVMKADGQEARRELGMFKVFVRHLYDSEAISTDGLKTIISLLLLL